MHDVERMKLLSKYVKKSDKFGGGSVMVWDMFSAAGAGLLVCINGKVYANVYQTFHQHQPALPNLSKSFSTICELRS